MVSSSSESQTTKTFSIDHESVLPKHYRLIELIGRGGMAEVFLAEDTRLARKVAIKFLSSEFRKDPDRVRRFRQEARSASALNHPNILTIHDIGDKAGTYFIVSEYVEGDTLGTRISKGRLGIAETAEIAIQIASALAAAHAAGIVHRDIKPDNIMVRPDGGVKVLDFGLAKARGFTTANGTDFDARTLDSGSTSPGLIVGTPQYMSPEQARGKELDGRTDVFSLGILIFEMVSRHSPFSGASFADTMAAILTKEPRQLNEFIENPPKRLVEILNCCLKKDRDERYGSMDALIEDLRLLKAEAAERPKPTTEIDAQRSDHTQTRVTHQHSVRRFVSDTFQKPSPIAAAIILAAAAVLVGGWWAWDRAFNPTAAPSLMRTVPITSWSGSASELVVSGSFSPDGRMVAFAARKGDATEIWVKPVSGGDAVQVTRDGGYNQYPVWSPSGLEILFFSDRGGVPGFWRVPFTGGAISEVLAGIQPATRPMLWTSSGSIYFQTRQDVFRTNVETGETSKVTDFEERGRRTRTIQVSDDEHLIAYSALDDDGWKIFVRELESGKETVVGRSTDQIDFLAWHPNSQSVLASLSVERALHIFESPIEGGEQYQRTNGDVNFVVQDVDRNGSVLYSTLSETSDLWRFDVEAKTESIVANEVALEFWPDISRDGSVTFQSGSYVERPELSSIRVLPASTGIMRQVSAEGFLPSWSNDGQWIAFFRKGESGFEIWRSRPDGVDRDRLTHAGVLAPVYSMTPYLTTSVSNISWSPDDSRIAYVAADKGTWRVFHLAPDAEGIPSPLGQDPPPGGREQSPFWTTDGKSILTTVISPANGVMSGRSYSVNMTNIASGERRILLTSSEPIRTLGLTADGRELIFAHRTDGPNSSPTPASTQIRSISLSTGHVRHIRSLAHAYFNNIHLSEDGNTVAFVTRVADRTAVSSSSLFGESVKEHVLLNDPKILISSLGLSKDGSTIVYGRQTRTNLLSMLTK